jgi:hypothetical protein
VKRVIEVHLFTQVIYYPLGCPGAHGHPCWIARHDAGDGEDDEGESEKNENGMDYTTDDESDEPHLPSSVRNPTEAPEEPTKPLRGLTLEGVLEVQISDLGGLERWFLSQKQPSNGRFLLLNEHVQDLRGLCRHF